MSSSSSTPSVATLHALVKKLKEHEPELGNYIEKMSRPKFVYDSNNVALEFMEQLELYLLQTLDKSKHFAGRADHLQELVVVPSLGEISQHMKQLKRPFPQGYPSGKRWESAACTYNALLRLILCGHNVIEKRQPVTRQDPGGNMFFRLGPDPFKPMTSVSAELQEITGYEYDIARTFDGKDYRLQITTDAPNYNEVAAWTWLYLYEDGTLKHAFSYDSVKSVFDYNNYEVEYYEASLSAAKTLLDERTLHTSAKWSQCNDHILPWLANFFFKGELPMYKEKHSAAKLQRVLEIVNEHEPGLVEMIHEHVEGLQDYFAGNTAVVRTALAFYDACLI